MALKKGDIIDEYKRFPDGCGLVVKVMGGGAGFTKIVCCGHELTEEDVVPAPIKKHGRKMGQKVIGAPNCGYEELPIARELVYAAKTVKSPRQSARPARIGAKTLFGALAQELPRLRVENCFVGRGAVDPDEVLLRGQAVRGGDATQFGR